MDAKLYNKMHNCLEDLNPSDPVTVPDALSFASYVLDNLCKAETCDTVDSLINKGILHHAMRQLDEQHRKAIEIRDSTA